MRSLVAIGADVGMPHDGFADFSLTMFLGLLAYDWLRVLIWFDHMGLRVATLVNLSFLGGDRLDEAAARFIGHGARTRAIPDGIRRFGTWAPLLIPFYIPRGAAWDKAWTGAEALSHGGADAGRGQDAGGRLRRRRRRRGRDGAGAGVALARGGGNRDAGSAAGGRAGGARRPAASLRRPQRLGRRRADARRPRRRLCRRRRARRLPDRPLPPTARSAAAARPFLLPLRGRRRAVVDRLVADAPRRRLRSRTDRLQPLPHQQYGQRPARDDGARPRSARGDPELAHPAGEPRRPGARAAAGQLLRNRRPRGRRLCARPRLRRHARRDGVRARAQRHSRPQPAAALGARRSRRDLVLRRQARRRLPS